MGRRASLRAAAATTDVMAPSRQTPESAEKGKGELPTREVVGQNHVDVVPAFWKNAFGTDDSYENGAGVHKLRRNNRFCAKMIRFVAGSKRAYRSGAVSTLPQGINRHRYRRYELSVL